MRKDEAAYGYINLLALVDSLLVEFEGDDGIFIPFRSNPSIYVSDRSVNLSVRVNPLKAGTDLRGNTHSVFAATNKTILEAMSENDKKFLLPFLGKLYPKAEEKEKSKVTTGPRVAKRISREVPADDTREDNPFDDIPF